MQVLPDDILYQKVLQLLEAFTHRLPQTTSFHKVPGHYPLNKDSRTVEVFFGYPPKQLIRRTQNQIYLLALPLA